MGNRIDIQAVISSIGQVRANLSNGIEYKSHNDYNVLENKPSINGVELVGDLSLSDLGIKDVNELFKFYPTIYDFPVVGEDNYFYIDQSTGDVFLWGIVGDYFTSVGVANDDEINGGDSTI